MCSNAALLFRMRVSKEGVALDRDQRWRIFVVGGIFCEGTHGHVAGVWSKEVGLGRRPYPCCNFQKSPCGTSAIII